MNELRAIRCERCQSLIVFIRTENGKAMPCDCNQVMYREDTNGEDRIFTRFGKLVNCTLSCNKSNFTGYGYKPHWGNCVSSEGRKRFEGLKQQANTDPKLKEPEPKPKAEEPKFEQLCLFGGDRRNRHPNL